MEQINKYPVAGSPPVPGTQPQDKIQLKQVCTDWQTDDNWLLELPILCSRCMSPGFIHNLARFTPIELWGLYCFLVDQRL